MMATSASPMDYKSDGGENMSCGVELHRNYLQLTNIGLGGFGRFKAELMARLSTVTIHQLATYFDYPSATKIDLRKCDSPGQLFVKYIEKSGYIGHNDITPLLRALKNIELREEVSHLKEMYENSKMNGFGRFKANLSQLLPTETIYQLATFFDYPLTTTGELRQLHFPGFYMVDVMEEGGQIKRSDITPLLVALANLEHREEASHVEDLYETSKINGFGIFKVDLAEFLSTVTIQRLANFFEYLPEIGKQRKKGSSVGLQIVNVMEDRCHIQTNDITPLIQALKKMKLHGEVAYIDKLFDQYKHKLYGFESFKCRLANVLSNRTIRRLKTVFEYPTEKEGSVDLRIINFMDARGHIRINDITPLTQALNEIKLDGEVEYIDQLFDQYKKHELNEKKQILITALKEKYKVQYDAVQPIPYIKDRLYCVDKVYVEGGIEVYHAKSWVRMESYKSIFRDPRNKSKRLILEGEPGYGKSTLTLQVAYDWCHSVHNSPLADVEILILLRLRQLGGISSIYRAIKLFLLPGERRIKVKDIEDILMSCTSVNITLDGYDEYPNRDISEVRSDVNKIIMMDMFGKFNVTLTTRYLPKHYDISTKVSRLTGFDDTAREEYIRKAVVGDNDNDVDIIKRQLRENSILTDLCQVPLIFVMFAHMAHENQELQQFKSVTGFFEYMIGCFHEHMKEKLKDINVKTRYHFENDHAKLNIIAFQGLSKENQQISWIKEEMIEQLGEDFYDQYLRVGILVEEEVYVTGQRGDDSQVKTEVRFFHKLFCEWYAGHFVAHNLRKKWVSVHNVFQKENSDINEDLFRNLDPADLQYVYRFACGLNKSAAKKIVKYLRSIPGGDKFAILCLLEQTVDTEDITDTVKDICSRNVELKVDDTILLQRSTIQLLDMASTKNENCKAPMLSLADGNI